MTVRELRERAQKIYDESDDENVRNILGGLFGFRAEKLKATKQEIAIAVSDIMNMLENGGWTDAELSENFRNIWSIHS